VAGVLRSSSGEDTHSFLLGLAKGTDGRLRIASEMKLAIAPPTYGNVPIGAEKIVEVLDDAGIRYATVLSTAYWFGDPEKQVADRWAGTRAENDWVIAETKKFPDRLIPFCGVNPVDDYGIAEMERCARLGVRGMKIHRNSKFRTNNPAHLEKLKAFFRAANKLNMAIVMHVRDEPTVLIDQVLPEAPDVPIQIAHMGSGFMKYFADAIVAGKPGTKNLWFDWTQAVNVEDLWIHGRPGGFKPLRPGEREEIAALMRKVGMGRILYGSDMPLNWNPAPREWWRQTVLTLPLTDAELRDIADNLPPYARR
jgi:predicted TIM-barrel fold metal-dependent hydrolase